MSIGNVKFVIIVLKDFRYDYDMMKDMARRNVYSLPCDSDTFGAIAGGVAEEYYHGFGDIEAENIINEHLTEELLSIML